ncbi:xylose isomerase [Paenibacillus sp. MSJ-34]|uniref:xylose isomerase n=1 Tax=Paenibacillus sp. MSJ-34 TaxID=2841529 RepID=UPI001C1022BD|nr:xylose isomerase [Paenibacillus sp. MSJ-34]MBU5440714.1 xylose isomerase [Paenibacillus sp. MSJ-34]
MAYFKNVQPIQFEGKDSTNPLAFKHYNPQEVVAGKTMEEHLRFAVAYWHTFTANGTDPFGAGTFVRDWDRYQGMDLAKARVEANFEFVEKLGVPYFCFHDRDIAPEGDTLQETNANLDAIVGMMKDYMKTSKVKLLWNTANMFTNPRFVHGAGTACNADVYAYAAAQVKKGLEVGKELGAENYVFWGGREGYETLLNTDMKLELDNLAHLYRMAIDYAQEIGFDAQFLIEPKPKEPTKHQYDTDAATTIAFLQTYGLKDHFKLNLEANHATLAGHTFEHELRVARMNGVLGSLDANQGDLLLGWDTDEFPTDLYSATLTMYEVLQNGGLGRGGVNFDAKVRRGSFEAEDLFHAHIAGMDTFAKGLKTAAKLIEDRVFEDAIDSRYASFTEGIGLEVVSGKATLRSLEAYALHNHPIRNVSGRQEVLRATLNRYLLSE